MLTFETEIKKFGTKGEKTGWTYIEIDMDQAEILNPSVKTSYRVKGRLDKILIKQTAILPMGEGYFILPLNADLRRQLKKQKGDKVLVKIELDNAEFEMDNTMMECIEDDGIASAFFNSFPASHQRYYSKWVQSAKTDETKAKRIAQILISLHLKQNYAEMIRSNKGK